MGDVCGYVENKGNCRSRRGEMYGDMGRLGERGWGGKSIRDFWCVTVFFINF